MELFKIYRFGSGLIILIAIAVQFLTFRQRPVNFFSYFTILSSLFAAFVFISSTLNIFGGEKLDILRGAATLYMIVTSLGFIVLLGGKNDEFLPWVNIVVHYLAPLVLLLDWIFIPSVSFSFSKALIWIVPMLIYLVYSLVRGKITSWYPYGFLNPREVGAKGVAIYSGVLTTVSLIITWILTKIYR